LFLFSHGAGLLTLHLLPPALGLSQAGVKAVGGVLTLVTLLFPLLSAAPALQGIVIAASGLLAAYLVLSWCPSLSRSKDALTALALAMVLANLIVGAANFPLSAPIRVGWELLALLPLFAAYRIAVHSDPAGEELLPAVASPVSMKEAALPLAAFALADYFVGGIWYQAAIGGAPVASVWWPAIESLLSSLGILLFYLRVRHDSVETLVRYALSLLGLGLLLAAAGPTGPLGVIAYRGLLLLGLVAGDLFYWHQLWRLGETYGVRRTMGLGLGGSLWLIGTATLVTRTGSLSLLPGPLFLLIGAAILFLAIPLIFRYRLPETVHPTPEALPGQPFRIPEGLTAAEVAIYPLLLSGASDQEIAARLVVSKHTVKFHVRNILHKAGVANRRELLSRLLAGEPLAPLPEEYPK
ncbi:MAG: LuxR C-terminal-related transcriptional regulator, partial [Bacillota bacterium]